jgi:hypothetical protein
VVFDAIVRRSTAASVFSTVLERELYRALRQEGGYSYTVSTDYEPRGDDHATLTALVDSLPDKQAAVLGGFVDVLTKLRWGNIDPADLAAARTQREEGLNNPLRDVGRLPGYCMNLLTGQPNRSIDELREELHAVTLEDVHSVAKEAVSTGLLQAPRGHTADWAGFTAAPMYSDTEVKGTVYPPRSSADNRLVVGPEGVSVVGPHGKATVRFDSCVAALAYPDGARQLIGVDGIIVRVEPTLYFMNPGTVDYIDGRLRPDQMVRLPARSADEIPQPRQATAPPAATPGAGTAETAPAAPPWAPGAPPPQGGQAPPVRGKVWETIGIIVLSVLLVPSAFVAVVGIVLAVGGGDGNPVSAWVAAACLLIPTLAMGAGVVLLVRRKLRRKRSVLR